MQILIDLTNDSNEQLRDAVFVLNGLLALREPDKLPTPKGLGEPVGVGPTFTIAKNGMPESPQNEITSGVVSSMPVKKSPTKKAPAVTKTVSPEQVRQLMIVKQGEGKSEPLKALLASFKAAKLSEVPLEALPDFMAKLEAL